MPKKSERGISAVIPYSLQLAYQHDGPLPRKPTPRRTGHLHKIDVGSRRRRLPMKGAIRLRLKIRRIEVRPFKDASPPPVEDHEMIDQPYPEDIESVIMPVIIWRKGPRYPHPRRLADQLHGHRAARAAPQVVDDAHRIDLRLLWRTHRLGTIVTAQI